MCSFRFQFKSIAARVFLLVFLSIFGNSAAGQDILNPTPYSSERQPTPTDESEWGHYLIRLYQQYLSGADGDRCPMAPSCSHYALEAFQKYGLIKGWIMTCDRLLRCGRDELRISPQVHIHGKIRCDDPLKNNDIWTSKEAPP